MVLVLCQCAACLCTCVCVCGVGGISGDASIVVASVPIIPICWDRLHLTSATPFPPSTACQRLFTTSSTLCLSSLSPSLSCLCRLFSCCSFTTSPVHLPSTFPPSTPLSTFPPEQNRKHKIATCPSWTLWTESAKYPSVYSKHIDQQGLGISQACSETSSVMKIIVWHGMITLGLLQN